MTECGLAEGAEAAALSSHEEAIVTMQVRGAATLWHCHKVSHNTGTMSALMHTILPGIFCYLLSLFTILGLCTVNLQLWSITGELPKLPDVLAWQGALSAE